MRNADAGKALRKAAKALTAASQIDKETKLSEIERVRNVLMDRAGLGRAANPNGTRAPGHSAPTERQVFQRVIDGNSGRDLALLDEDIEAISRAVDRIVKITGATLNVRVPAGENFGAKGCRLCGLARRWKFEKGRKVDAGRHPESFKKAEYGDLCGTCHFFIETYGEEPHPWIVEWQLDHPGSKVPPATLRELHPAAFARHHGPKRASAPSQPGPEAPRAPERPKPLQSVDNLAADAEAMGS